MRYNNGEINVYRIIENSADYYFELLIFLKVTSFQIWDHCFRIFWKIGIYIFMYSKKCANGWFGMTGKIIIIIIFAKTVRTKFWRENFATFDIKRAHPASNETPTKNEEIFSKRRKSNLGCSKIFSTAPRRDACGNYRREGAKKKRKKGEKTHDGALTPSFSTFAK